MYRQVLRQVFLYSWYMGHAKQKGVFKHAQKAQIQIHPMHARSLIQTFALRWYIHPSMILLADSLGPDQTARMPRLVWAFTVPICTKTGFHIVLLIYWSALQIYAPSHNKTYKKTCTTSKDSDQPVHPSSMARVLIHPWTVEGTFDQQIDLWCRCTGWSVFAGCTRLIAGFVLRWLIFYLSSLHCEN